VSSFFLVLSSSINASLYPFLEISCLLSFFDEHHFLVVTFNTSFALLIPSNLFVFHPLFSSPLLSSQVSEQLAVYQSTLKGKSKQLKAMASELNMYQGSSDPPHSLARCSFSISSLPLFAILFFLRARFLTSSAPFLSSIIVLSTPYCFSTPISPYTAQVNEYKYEIERTNRELQDVKRKYYQQRRKEQLAEEMDGIQGMMND
jgi:hypothetical protein